ncbi:MAG TPA: Glu/Leu/Phe/Val dehydrogenase dimerization domain-containing protein [Acidimicrobiales bacterium]|nr:Glu/Leu/Phe/Val dehydrogenase dimerization domain-containing protein [Acidimicrobiales bacterium]
MEEPELDGLLEKAEHEEIRGAWRSRSGLRAIVAIHSTALGPSLGGTRFRPYETVADALADVLRLSQAMSYKAAMAGLDLGGGKAVIIGSPARLRSPALWEDYAAFLDGFGGRYYTAEDVGTTQADMDEIGRHTSYVTGRSVEAGGSGDPSPVTAYGVLRAMQATVRSLFAAESLEGRTIAISGVGKVGHTLAELAAAEGAKVVVGDIDATAARRAAELTGATVVPVGEVHRTRCDIFAPCALGGALDESTVAELACEAVVGAANNQLASPEMADRLHDRGIAYVPDYVANAGGIINIAYERGRPYDPEAARAHVGRIYDTVLALFNDAASTGETLEVIAERTAKQRIAAARVATTPGEGAGAAGARPA